MTLGVVELDRISARAAPYPGPLPLPHTSRTANEIFYGVPGDEAWHQYNFLLDGQAGGSDLTFTIDGDREGGGDLDDVSVRAVPALEQASPAAATLVRRRKRG